MFQGMFFWLQAARLLSPKSPVKRVILEHDQAAGVDDVSVHYEHPGINAAGRSCAADYFQVKYHVDRTNEYAAASLCDPTFLGATKSLLQRFQEAQVRIGDGDGWHRLSLVSNWRWASADALGPLVREAEGALPDAFFSAGPRSKLGKVRIEWRDHLQLTDDDFEDFARRLRLRVDFLGRADLRDWLNDRFAAVGLRQIPPDRSQNVYDSLTQQFIMNGINEFDAHTFREVCAREDLLTSRPEPGPPVLGIRSFMRFAERMEDECASFVCVAKHFDGRHIRHPETWQTEVLKDTRSFLNDASFRAQEHHLLLECHSTLAFLAGYELDRKSGAQVFPVQKGALTTVWRPSTDTALTTTSGEWTVETTEVSKNGADVAFAVSVSRNLSPDVSAFLARTASIKQLVHAQPSTGFGARAVIDANHAIALADKLAELIRSTRSGGGGVTHLFLSVPNVLAFYLGQHRAALGKIQLYEFDFEWERDGSYVPSIFLPAL